MLQTANTELFNPLVTVLKAHKSECHNLLFLLQIKPVKVILKLNLRIFIVCTLGTNGLATYMGVYRGGSAELQFL